MSELKLSIFYEFGMADSRFRD